MIDLGTEKNLRKKFGELITDVESLLEQSPIHKNNSDYKTKLSNLIGAAKSSSCLKQIELFVQYQAARERDFREDHFAENLLTRLAPGGKIAKVVESVSGGGGNDEQANFEVIRFHRTSSN